LKPRATEKTPAAESLFWTRRGNRVIKHIVLWKLKDFAEGADKHQNARKIETMLLGLKERIPQLKEIEVGINVLPSDASYDVALYSSFNNEHDLEIYQKHPEHLKVAEFVSAVRENRVVVDYRSE
jgi:hypothetical protein